MSPQPQIWESNHVSGRHEFAQVNAYTAWVEAAHLATGPVFRAIDRWGRVSDTGLHGDSIAPLLRAILAQAGIASSELYSGHSLRRGFANWATANGWSLKTLMEYVAWQNVQSAMRYVEAADPFSKHHIESTTLPVVSYGTPLRTG